MARTLTNLYQINGTPLYAPDEDQDIRFEDIDAANTGRTEDGVMHRYPVRYKVGKWVFKYASLTEAEKNYLENLIPDAPSFTFTHPSRTNSNVLVTSTCYCSKHQLQWYSKRTGKWRNFQMDIIEC